jgi:hypothetical protein
VLSPLPSCPQFLFFSLADFAKSAPAFIKPALPYLKQIKPYAEMVFGDKAFTGFKVDLTHLLLAAILIVLIGMWRSQHIANQISKKALAPEGESSGKGKKKAE